MESTLQFRVLLLFSLVYVDWDAVQSDLMLFYITNGGLLGTPFGAENVNTFF